MTDVVCLGILVADVIARPVDRVPDSGSLALVGEIVLRGGGCALNTGTALTRLGLSVACAGKVGGDAFGDFVIGLLDERGVDRSLVARDASMPTSATVVLVDEAGERTFLHVPGANGTVGADELDLDRVLAARALHVAGALVMPALDGEPTATLLAEAQRRGVTTSLDTVWDATGEWSRLEPSLPHLDLLCLSHAEACALSGSCQGGRDSRDHARCRRVLRRGRRVCRARSRSPRRGRRRTWRRRRVRRRDDLRPPPGLVARAGERFRQQGWGRRDDGGRCGRGAAEDRGGARVIARLNRLFAADGKCFDVAVDHGFFGEASFLSGIEDMEATIATLVDAGPDAIQLSTGQAPLLQRVPGPSKPALVLRTDVANVYGPEVRQRQFSELVAGAVERAVQLDAACVVVNLLLLPDEPDLLRQCVCNVSTLRSACERVGMPLMVEPLVFAPGERGYGSDGDVEKIVPLVRQAVELGADVIKCDPTDELADFARVLQVAAPRPVLVRGGGKAPEDEILRRTEELMRLGAAGIVYGRNVIQHDDPAGMTRRLMAVVHG